MACVLRVSAPSGHAQALVARLAPYRVEEREGRTALHCDVSDAGLGDLPAQIADACAYLRAFGGPLPDGCDAVLDFAIAHAERPAQGIRLPRGLVALAAAAGVGLEVSLYAVSGR